MNLYNVLIEITRKCNMFCDHCLRGDQQDIVIEKSFIDALMSKVDSITELTITGGEPSLHPEIIEYIIESARKHSVEIFNFYIVTNGKKVSNEFLLSIFNLWCYCSDNESSGVALSTDQWHKDQRTSGNSEHGKLKVFSFYNTHGPESELSLINDGKAYDNGIGSRDITIYGFDVDEPYVNGQLYLNCLGDVLPDCDLSYQRQSESDNIVCGIYELSMEKLKNFKQEE